MWVAFAFAKATHIFFSKNTCELDIVLTRTVNILTTNEFVKLTMLWTFGPRTLKTYCVSSVNLILSRLNKTVSVLYHIDFANQNVLMLYFKPFITKTYHGYSLFNSVALFQSVPTCFIFVEKYKKIFILMLPWSRALLYMAFNLLTHCSLETLKG